MGVVLDGSLVGSIEQALVHHAPHLQGGFPGHLAALPASWVRPRDVAQEDVPPSLVLQLDQRLDLLLCLPPLPQEDGREVLQGHSLAVEVEGHGQVQVGGMELHVDVSVEGGLAFPAVVLEHS